MQHLQNIPHVRLHIYLSRQQMLPFALAGQGGCEDRMPTPQEFVGDLAPGPAPQHRTVDEDERGHAPSLRLPSQCGSGRPRQYRCIGPPAQLASTP